MFFIHLPPVGVCTLCTVYLCGTQLSICTFSVFDDINNNMDKSDYGQGEFNRCLYE